MGSTSRIVGFVALFLVVLATTGYAFPQEEQVNFADEVHLHANSLVDQLPVESSNDAADAIGEQHPYRTKRLTCDLLSGLRVGNAACKTRCLFSGKRGGTCNEMRQCICRNKGE